MKLSVGSLLATITLIGSILIGGANFGELRSQTASNKSYNIDSRVMFENRSVAIRNEMSTLSASLRSENMEMLKLVAQMNSDVRWIKHILSEKRDR